MPSGQPPASGLSPSAVDHHSQGNQELMQHVNLLKEEIKQLKQM